MTYEQFVKRGFSDDEFYFTYVKLLKEEYNRIISNMPESNSERLVYFERSYKIRNEMNELEQLRKTHKTKEARKETKRIIKKVVKDYIL